VEDSFWFDHALAPGPAIGCYSSRSDEIAAILARGRTGGTIGTSFPSHLSFKECYPEQMLRETLFAVASGQCLNPNL